MSSWFERRREVREPVQGQALIVRGRSAYVVDLVNLSRGGACFRRPRAFAMDIGDDLLFYLLGREAGPVMTMDADVAWCSADEVGLKF
jgi:hypothetical protein